MRALLVVTWFAALVSNSSVSQASLLPIEVVGSYPLGECSVERNSWDFPSWCHCAESTFYFSEAGLCIPMDQELPDFMAAGKLLSDELAAGAESSGFVLASDSENYELILTAKNKDLLERLDGGFLEARGKLIYLPAEARQVRPAIVVEAINDGETREPLDQR